MPNHRSFAPEWNLTPLSCPKCDRSLRARHNPNTGSLEALRCPACNWYKDFLADERKRKARLAAARRRNPPSSDLQTDLTRTGAAHNGH